MYIPCILYKQCVTSTVSVVDNFIHPDGTPGQQGCLTTPKPEKGVACVDDASCVAASVRKAGILWILSLDSLPNPLVDCYYSTISLDLPCLLRVALAITNCVGTGTHSFAAGFLW